MKIPPIKLSKPLIWITLAAAPIPFFLFLFHFLFGMQKLGQLEEEMERIHRTAARLEETKRSEDALLSSLKNPDPHYLDKHVETLTFLVPETKKLESFFQENPDQEELYKRIAFLRDGGNRLTFAEEQIRSNETFREIEERQQTPVEMNEEDLKRLLCLIEGATIWPYGPKEGRPQLIIKDFTLSKKELPSQEKVYVVSIQLIKRENNEDRK